MAISKSTAIVGTLVGGGGITVTGVTIKYVASSREATALAKIKNDIEKWAKSKENGECIVRIKLSEQDTYSKTIEKIENRKTLEDLYGFLGNPNKTAETKNKCNKDKVLEVTKGTNNNSWTTKEVEKSTVELEDVRYNINNWASTNGGCTIKIKTSSTDNPSKELNSVTDKSVLDGLYGFLNDSTKNQDIIEKCKPNGNNRIVEATKGSDNNTWTFEEPK